MTSTKQRRERYEALKAMNTLAKLMNNEEFYYHWITVIPDGADNDELEEIATDDLDSFKEACELFGNNFTALYQDGGLYIGDKVF